MHLADLTCPSSGDFVFADFKKDLEDIIDRGMATALVYGDADYIVRTATGYYTPSLNLDGQQDRF